MNGLTKLALVLGSLAAPACGESREDILLSQRREEEMAVRETSPVVQAQREAAAKCVKGIQEAQEICALYDAATAKNSDVTHVDYKGSARECSRFVAEKDPATCSEEE